MSATPTSPQSLRAGFLVLDAAIGALAQILPFQYNPQQLVHSVGPHGESFTIVTEYDVSDGSAAAQDVESELGIAPQLAALRSIAAEPPAHVIALVWGPTRVVPVRFESLTVTETLFDRALHPLAATAVLELTVQTPDAGGSVIGRIGTAYEREQQQLATVSPSTSLAALGLDGIP